MTEGPNYNGPLACAAQCALYGRYTQHPLHAWGQRVRHKTRYEGNLQQCSNFSERNCRPQ